MPACVFVARCAGQEACWSLTAEESLLSSPNTNNLTLLKRKGFVKLASSVAPTRPVYAFINNVRIPIPQGSPPCNDSC